jgi:hypothetical protein
MIYIQRYVAHAVLVPANYSALIASTSHASSEGDPTMLSWQQTGVALELEQ